MLAKFLLSLGASIAAFIFVYSYSMSNAQVSSIAKSSLEKTIYFLEKGKKDAELKPRINLQNLEIRLNNIRNYWNAAQQGKPFGKAAKVFFLLFSTVTIIVGLIYLGAACCAWWAHNLYKLFIKDAFIAATLACIMLFFSARYQLGATVKLYYEIQNAIALIPGAMQLPDIDEMLRSSQSINLVAMIIALQLSFFILFAPSLVYFFIKIGEKKNSHV